MQVQDSARFPDLKRFKFNHAPINDFGRSGVLLAFVCCSCFVPTDLQKAIFKKCFAFISEAKEKKASILVHCSLVRSFCPHNLVWSSVVCRVLIVRRPWCLVIWCSMKAWHWKRHTNTPNSADRSFHRTRTILRSWSSLSWRCTARTASRMLLCSCDVRLIFWCSVCAEMRTNRRACKQWCVKCERKAFPRTNQTRKH